MNKQSSDNKELLQLAFITTISILFAFYALSVRLLPQVFDFFQAYNQLPLAEFLFNFTFLYLTGLLLFTYHSWRIAERERAGLNEILSSISPDVLMVSDRDMKIIKCNSSIENVFGYDMEEIMNQDIGVLFSNGFTIEPSKTLIGRDDHEKKWGYLNDYIAASTISAAIGRKKNGDFFPLEVLSVKLQNGGAVLLLRDITERKNAEEMLMASEARYRAIFETTGAATAIIDENLTILMSNRKFQALTSCPKEELEGKKSLTEFIDKERFETAHGQRGLVDVKAADGSNELSLIDIHGNKRDVVITLGSISGTDLSVTSFTDITELNRMKEELLKVKKLSSISVLAGGIAHDFNNYLTSVLGNVSLSRMYVDKGSKAFELLKEAEKATFQAKNVAQSLLTFARGGKPIKRTISMLHLLTNATDLALSGSNVKCVYSIPNDLWFATVDEAQINQAINSLILNSIQAMPAGGIVRVSAENVVLKKGDIPSLIEGYYVKIDIRDEGEGIPKKNLHNIFDPF
ncbi:MAG: PAS domain S-box protein, partial [Nitrospirae bacterium]|nr:PAS domain S-box protein [Nitrospirota bacterium]